MKNVVLCVMLMFAISGFTQTFAELGDEWHNHYVHHIMPSGPGQGTSHIQEAAMFKYVGDTIIGTDHYQIIVKCKKRWGIGFYGFPAEYENDSIYVYQDSLQVFCGQPGNMKLIYDFNLSLGDSTMIYTGWNGLDSQYVHVIQTDSIEVDATWRKRIIFSAVNNFHSGMRWVEGVGDELYGVFRVNIGDYFDLHYSFFMKHENVVQIGNGSVIYTCAEEWMGSNMNELEPITIYPNPTSDQITIKYPGKSENYLVRLYDIAGSLVYVEEADDDLHMLDLNYFNSGIYLIRITDAFGEYTSRIIKK